MSQTRPTKEGLDQLKKDVELEIWTLRTRITALDSKLSWIEKQRYHLKRQVLTKAQIEEKLGHPVTIKDLWYDRRKPTQTS